MGGLGEVVEGRGGGRKGKKRKAKKKKKKVRKSFTLSTLRISLMAAWAMLVVDFFLRSIFVFILFTLPLNLLFLRTYFPSPSLNSKQGGK